MKELHGLYEQLARLKKEWDTWSFYILTSYPPYLEKCGAGLPHAEENFTTAR